MPKLLHMKCPELPSELWVLIGGYLSTADLRRLALASKKIHDAMMGHKQIWMVALKREGKYLDSYAYFPLSVILQAQKQRMVAPMFLSGCYK
jgi:hypothetical protein